MAKIKIDNKEYNIEDLNDVAKLQINNIQYVDQKINDLKAQIATLNAAREYYTAILKANLPKETAEEETIKFDEE
ncbi:DUF6447 family protein [Caminibacter sp.]